MRDPGDVLVGIETHVGEQARGEEVPAAASSSHAYGSPLQVADRADLIDPERLETANVDPREEDERVHYINRAEVHAQESAGEIDLARGEVLGSCTTRHVLDLVEPFNVKQLFSNQLRGAIADPIALA
jgi:hypothetical protein